MRCTSKDGTQIAYEQSGSGPPLVLIPGALCDRATGPNASLAERLADGFTVIVYDRRGRGDSGDTPPYSVRREVEDLEALIDAAGGKARLYGISSGGALALDAAAQLPGKVTEVAAYEIPLVIDDTRPPVSEASVRRLHELLEADERGGAVKLFMREMVQLPSVLIAAMPLFRGAWAKNKALAHTLAYDVEIMGETQRGAPIPADRWASLSVPTLVAAGAKSPEWVRNGSAQLAAVLPGVAHVVLERQRHYVKPEAIAPILSGFFSDAKSNTGARPPADQRGRRSMR